MQSPFADRFIFVGRRRNENPPYYFALPGTIRHGEVASGFPGSRSQMSSGITSVTAKTARLPGARFSFVLSNSSSATALRRLP